MSTRTSLMPPAVEPAQPPANAASKSSVGAAAGHSETFSVTNPVVVAKEIVWKMPCRSAES